MTLTHARRLRFMGAIIAATSLSGLLAAENVPPPVDLTRLPVGDGRISTKPERGSVWACRTAGFGARRSHGGEWIRSDGTFDFTAKPAVEGKASWPHLLTITREKDRRRIAGNNLPSHPTGQFPIGRSTKAYRYDPNPNPIRTQNILIDLPTMPTLAANASCVPLGPVGTLLTGAVFFNALDANGQDGVAHEIQDQCQGHPQGRGVYHYHSLTSCQRDDAPGHSALVGYTFDGFGIYGRRGEGGKVVANGDLDECHGHTHEIAWDDQRVSLYHYHATWEYPYTIGCYRGKPERLPR
jgi:hypothetical protein